MNIELQALALDRVDSTFKKYSVPYGGVSGFFCEHPVIPVGKSKWRACGSSGRKRSCVMTPVAIVTDSLLGHLFHHEAS